MTQNKRINPEYPNQEYSGLVIPEAAIYRTRTKKNQLMYFFLDGKLHKRLSSNRGRDIIVTWHYEDHAVKRYNYSTVMIRHKRAFTTSEVAAMIGRSRRSIQQAVANGNIVEPTATYSLSGKPKKLQWFWQEEEIFDVLYYFSGVTRGRGRGENAASPVDLPTPRELRAMINNEDTLYVKRGDQIVPTWRAPIL